MKAFQAWCCTIRKCLLFFIFHKSAFLFSRLVACVFRVHQKVLSFFFPEKKLHANLMEIMLVSEKWSTSIYFYLLVECVFVSPHHIFSDEMEVATGCLLRHAIEHTQGTVCAQPIFFYYPSSQLDTCPGCPCLIPARSSSQFPIQPIILLNRWSSGQLTISITMQNGSPPAWFQRSNLS